MSPTDPGGQGRAMGGEGEGGQVQGLVRGEPVQAAPSLSSYDPGGQPGEGRGGGAGVNVVWRAGCTIQGSPHEPEGGGRAGEGGAERGAGMSEGLHLLGLGF